MHSLQSIYCLFDFNFFWVYLLIPLSPVAHFSNFFKVNPLFQAYIFGKYGFMGPDSAIDFQTYATLTTKVIVIYYISILIVIVMVMMIFNSNKL